MTVAATAKSKCPAVIPGVAHIAMTKPDMIGCRAGQRSSRKSNTRPT